MSDDTSNPDFVYESWSKTEHPKVKGRHRWTIDDLLDRAASAKEDDVLESRNFFVAKECFYLNVCLNGAKGHNNSDCIAVYLHHGGKLKEDLEVKFDFSVEAADGTTQEKDVLVYKFESNSKEGYGYPNWLSKTTLKAKAADLLPNGKLAVICNLEFSHADLLTGGNVPDPNTEKTPSLGDNMRAFFGNAAFSDVKLVCGDSEYACHKIMLAARSDVFAAMFSHQDTVESQSNQVVITDIKPEAMEKLLQFVYSDKCEVDAACAAELLFAADKYNILRLKRMCEEFLCSNISVSNFDEALILGFLHGALLLKKMAMEFVLHNKEVVKTSQGWAAIKESHTQIMAELCAFLMA